MAHYKNRKPKSFKGCCGMCCLQRTDGRRNHRLLTRQELQADIAESNWETEHEEEVSCDSPQNTIPSTLPE